jgi:hypothetical protein
MAPLPFEVTGSTLCYFWSFIAHCRDAEDLARPNAANEKDSPKRRRENNNLEQNLGKISIIHHEDHEGHEEVPQKRKIKREVLVTALGRAVNSASPR